MTTLDAARVRRYLLGQMSEDEVEALEGEYFAHAETLEQVWGIENDLVDAYVAGELAPAERSAFESHYLASPLHRDRVASARALRAAVAESPARAPLRRATAWTPWLALAAGVVLILAAWWLQTRPRPRPDVMAQAQPTPSAAPTVERSEAAPTPTAAPRTIAPAYAVSLPPVLLRGSQATPVLRIPAGTADVAITLEGDPPEGVAAGTRLPFTVSTVEGTVIARGNVRSTPTGLGTARVAARHLAPGDYILSVQSDRSAQEGPLRRYFFRVLHP